MSRRLMSHAAARMVLAVTVAICAPVRAQVVTEFADGITAGAAPRGIALGADQNLWFVERSGNRIGRITPQGVVTEFGAGLSEGSDLHDIAAGADGNLWFTEFGTGQIGRITPSGVVTEFRDGLSPVAQPLPRIAAGPGRQRLVQREDQQTGSD